jgi:hypothetical protein
MIHGLDKLPPVTPIARGRGAPFRVQLIVMPQMPRSNKLARFIARSPMLIKKLQRFRRPEDIGLGDTVARLAGGAQGKRFAGWFMERIGKICGCDDAQNWLNRMFPY